MDFNLKKLSETCRVVVQESDIKKQFYGLKGLSNLKKIGVEIISITKDPPPGSAGTPDRI